MSPQSIPAAVLGLDEEETPRNDSVFSSSSTFPCIDKLRKELSCAICLEIYFEPSTTPCGHSFCRKCLQSAADKCSKRCPKCRQLLSNGIYCTVNTVLWNTIQLLFPQEVEARKVTSAINSHLVQCPSSETAFYNNLSNGSTQATGASSRGVSSWRSRDEDAALARTNLRAWYMMTNRVWYFVIKWVWHLLTMIWCLIIDKVLYPMINEVCYPVINRVWDLMTNGVWFLMVCSVVLILCCVWYLMSCLLWNMMTNGVWYPMTNWVWYRMTNWLWYLLTNGVWFLMVCSVWYMMVCSVWYLTRFLIQVVLH